MMTRTSLNAQMIQTILSSAICLDPVWGRSFELARMVEKLPQSVRDIAMPYTAQVNLEAAYHRASEVILINTRRDQAIRQRRNAK